MKKWQYILAFLVFLFIGFSCEKQDLSDSEIESEILTILEENKIASVVACYADTNGIQWTSTYGYLNKENQVPATEETMYTLQSISKLILAVSVFQLWENGQIDLDQDINTYLPFEVRNPQYPDEIITPYHLLTHTSGLAWPHDDDLLYDFHHFYTDEDPPLLRDWLPEYIFPDGVHYKSAVWKDFKPGEKWLYSNIGTSLLALVVEGIAGIDYRDYCREHILDPLEMYSSTFWLDELIPENVATPYYGNGEPMDYFSSRHYPVGWLFTNVTEFSNFVQACLNNGRYKDIRIMQESTMEKMLELQYESSGVAYLWWHGIGDRMGHKGGGAGYSTWFEMHTESKTALFLFSNKENDFVSPGGRIHELIKYQSQKY